MRGDRTGLPVEVANAVRLALVAPRLGAARVPPSWECLHDGSAIIELGPWSLRETAAGGGLYFGYCRLCGAHVVRCAFWDATRLLHAGTSAFVFPSASRSVASAQRRARA